MNSPTKDQLEARLQYPLANTLPEAGQALKVAPGVKWIRMGLPFALDHINLWLLSDQINGVAGWTIVDCCIDHAASRAQWEQVFKNELDGLPVLRVIVTHMHPDHIGLAHWLCERWNVSMWLSGTDFNVARLASQSTAESGGESAAAFFRLHGMKDEQSLAQIRARSSYFSSLVPQVPNQYRRMMDGQTIAIGDHRWRCISGFGHAPEHIALYCETLGVLISGDMVLPRISTNVSVHDHEPESDALTLFLDSLQKFQPLPADTLVLPSHGKPFTGLHERIRQLNEHHQDRLAELLEACRAAPCNAMDIIPTLFSRALDFHQTTFAMGEAVAHLHRLWFGGLLKRELASDGTLRFSAVTAGTA